MIQPDHYVLEIVERINLVEPASVNQGVKHSGCPGAVMGTGEEVVLSTQSDWAHLALNRIIVELEATITQKVQHFAALLPGVVKCLSQSALRLVLLASKTL